MKKIISVGIVIAIMIGLGIFSGCTGCDEFAFHVPTFEEKCVTTEDGFVYYPVEEEGVYIIDIPDTEEVTIPEYIDGQKVMQLGYKDMGLGYMKTYTVIGENTKKVIVSNPIIIFSASFDLDTLIYVDFLYVVSKKNSDLIKIDNFLGNQFEGQNTNTTVQLLHSERKFEVSNSIRFIEIPKYVSVIESGVFDGLEGVTIKTSYENKPDGWAEGWNGTCAVEWGVEIE